jgi:hypothetical protein
VEVIGAYSNLSEQGERVKYLLTMMPSGPPEEKKRAPKQVQRRLRPAEIAELVTGYESGLTVYELGNKHRIHRVTVSSLLKREGIPLRGQSLTPEQVIQSISLYVNGLSLKRVADEIGCSDSTIWNALRARGIMIRTRNGWES